MRLDGEVAVVTGAAGGIGLAIRDRFAREGARVAALDLRVPPHGDVRLACDLGDDDAVAHAATAIADTIGPPTIVVHAAALSEEGSAAGTPSSVYRRLHNVNVVGAVRLLSAFAPGMQSRRHGAFVLISSINASFATPNLAAYASSKAALDSVMRTAALELAPDNVRVNSIRPASIDTPLLRDGYARTGDAAAARARNILRHPLGRIGTAEDVANLVLFLASSEASWITGASYAIDGGASVTRR